VLKSTLITDKSLLVYASTIEGRKAQICMASLTFYIFHEILTQGVTRI